MLNSTFVGSFSRYNNRRVAELSDDQILRMAPSVFANQAHESRGARYAYIPTSEVLAGLRREGFTVTAAGQTNCRDEGKTPFTRHMLRLRHPDSAQLLNVGDEIPEIVLLNSHDGTSSYQLSAGVFRLACANGMVVQSSTVGDIKVRHTGRVVDDVLEGTARVIEQVRELAPVIQEYKGIALSRPEQLLLAETALDLRWDRDEEGNSLAPISPEGVLSVRRYDDRKDDLWTTFNRVQENLIKGGVRGHTTTGKRTTTRAVSGVTENVKLNKALWSLAEKFAQLKTAH